MLSLTTSELIPSVPELMEILSVSKLSVVDR